MILRLAILLLVPAGGALAQPADPGPWRGHLDACLARPDAAPEEARDCIGKAAHACMEGEEGGWSTLGMTSCTMMEQGLWDDLLNAEWPGHMQGARDLDEEERPFFDGVYSKREEHLLAAQRAWIAFRDAECELAYAAWGSGSMRNTAYAGCMLDMTADRVLELRDIWSVMR